MYLSVFACIYVCTMCLPDALEGQKMVSEPPGLEF